MFAHIFLRSPHTVGPPSDFQNAMFALGCSLRVYKLPLSLSLHPLELLHALQQRFLISYLVNPISRDLYVVSLVGLINADCARNSL